jgi:DNA-binding NarL/FixJ family response regulator
MSASEAKRITCVVADDHRAIVDAVSMYLVADGVDVVAGVQDGADALAAIQEFKPSVAVLDIDMPTLGGLDVARSASRLVPGTAVILYTGYDEREVLVEALDAGARAFLLKATPPAELVRAVRLVAAGSMYVDPVLAPTLLRAGARATQLPSLSKREREILRLLADGKSNDEMAKELLISADTVRTYLRRAMEKLDADTRTQAVAIALRQSLIA